MSVSVRAKRDSRVGAIALAPVFFLDVSHNRFDMSTAASPSRLSTLVALHLEALVDWDGLASGVCHGESIMADVKEEDRCKCDRTDP